MSNSCVACFCCVSEASKIKKKNRDNKTKTKNHSQQIKFKARLGSKLNSPELPKLGALLCFHLCVVLNDFFFRSVDFTKKKKNGQTQRENARF